MIEEIASDLPEPPDVMILSVGGGGLLCGVVEGMAKVGWEKVPILCMETVGADCFNQAVKTGEIVYLPDITRLVTTGNKMLLLKRVFFLNVKFTYMKARSFLETIRMPSSSLECLSVM